MLQDADTHRYYLGPMVFELGLTAAPRFNLREICHPAMTRIAEATGDTVFLTQRSGLDAVCVDRQEGTFPIKTFTLEIGMRRPLGVGTGSLAILSALSEDEVKHVIASNTPRLSEYGLTPTSLLAQVKRAQKLGYAVREMPTLAGVRSVGQALHNQSGIAFAALVGLRDFQPHERKARRRARHDAQETKRVSSKSSSRTAIAVTSALQPQLRAQRALLLSCLSRFPPSRILEEPHDRTAVLRSLFQ